MLEIQNLPLASIEEPTVTLRPISQAVVSDLAKSIMSSGLLQPIMVRPEKGGYQLVFGFHRMLACRQLGWIDIPAVIKEMSTDEVLLFRIVENIQRNVSMNVLEEGKAYKNLMQKGWTVSQVSKAIGKSDSYVLDRVRVVEKLRPDLAKEAVINSHLTASHVIRIAYVSDHDEQLELANLVRSEKISVRELERIIALYKSNRHPELGLAELIRRFKTFNLDRWTEGIFPGPDGRISILRSETFNMIVDGLGERAHAVGMACGRSTLKKLSPTSKDGMKKCRIRSQEKRVREFNIRSGWGVLNLLGGAVELRNPILKNVDFLRGYLEGLLTLNLKVVASSEQRVLLRVVRRRVYNEDEGNSIYSI
ncbi:MAG: ParB/RepB/Spo0J family partition protein [Candidatus Bathyarchaeia archaeon]|jgi:ParB/RepB/Spo0J family partition protein